ncbi:MAG: CopG family transcriptional regulator [Dehalococcoidia bacterium]|nr:CopG family transcriptional regulator [Dehalococcoidia bacterium]
MERKDFELGRDVTAQAKAAKGKRDSVVLSVRISGDVLRRLETLAQGTGRSVSQLARDALTAYTPTASGSQTTSFLTIAFPATEVTTRFGSPSQATGLSIPATTR